MRNDQIYDLSGNGVISNVTARNTVLRNTYWLLAASMAPTVFRAWLGVSAGFSLLSATSPGMSMLLFMGITIAFMFAIARFKNSGIGVALSLGFNYLMGVMLARLLSFIRGFSNGASRIMLAF